MGIPLYKPLCFSLASFRIFSFSLTFAILIMICLGVALFGLILFDSVLPVPECPFPSSGLGNHAAAAAAAKSLQSCPTLCDPIDGSLPGSPVPGILQARTLEWVAISFSNVWKWKVNVKSLSRVWLLVTSWSAAYRAPPSMGFSRQEYWSGLPLPSLLGNHSFLKYIFNPLLSLLLMGPLKCEWRYICVCALSLWLSVCNPMGECWYTSYYSRDLLINYFHF